MTPRFLAFDPTPAGLVAAKTLRTAFKNEWARIRTRRFGGDDFHCDLCGEDRGRADRLDGHEVYAYPSPQVVRLARILYLCRLCHDATHLERTRRFCEAAYVQEVAAHYCRLNGGLTPADLTSDFTAHLKEGFALREFYGGAKASPAVDYGEYQAGVDLCLARQRKRAVDLDDSDGDDSEMYPDHECPWDIGHAD
jgi:hypothetical protein